MRARFTPIFCAIVLLLGVVDAVSEGLAQVPPVRRGADGQMEVIPPKPQPPAAKVAPLPGPSRETNSPSRSGSPPPANNPTAGANPSPTSAQQALAEISLPEPLVVEMPNGKSELSPSDDPLRTLLAAAASGQRRITNDQTLPVRVGLVKITFTAWQGEPWKSPPAGIKTAIMHVLPSGSTSVGITGDENSTTNNSAKIVRDARGRVHMVWVDGGRPNIAPRILYRRATVSADNTVVWEIDAIRVGDAGADKWNAYPGLAVAGESIHVTWQGEHTALYRQLSFVDGVWKWKPIRDTAAPSEGRDSGPAIAATTGVLHIATPSGYDAVSRDNGDSWKAERIPLPAGRKPKTVSVTVDRLGNAHFALSAIVRGPDSGSGEKGSRGYWELLYIRRSAGSAWSNPENVLAAFPDWQEPLGNDDVLADWVRILADDANNLHLTWHGTAETRIYSHDHAYYTEHPASSTAAWHTPISLVPHGTPNSRPFSFAPSLAVEGETATAVTFFDVFNGDAFAGFDALAQVIKGGILDGQPVPITQFVRKSIDEGRPETALSARFPAAAPNLYRDAQGRVWLDLLETLIPSEGDPKLIVYQRVDVTKVMGQR